MSEPANLDQLTLELSRAELTLLNNALNEVCNGVEIEEWEFSTRLGASRDEARELLQRIHTLLDGKGFE
jgi:hypothetical protein